MAVASRQANGSALWPLGSATMQPPLNIPAAPKRQQRLASSKASTLFIAAVEMTTSSNTGTLPPTSPVLPPCRHQGGWTQHGRRRRGRVRRGGGEHPGARWLPARLWQAGAGATQGLGAQACPADAAAPAAGARLRHHRQPALAAVPQQRGRLLGGAGLEGHPGRALILAHPVPTI